MVTAVIDARDRVNHYQDGGLPIKNFAVLGRPDGTIEVPRWSTELELGIAMTSIWENFFRYVEAFIVLAVNFRIPETFALFRSPQPMSSPEPAWRLISKTDAIAMLKKEGHAIPELT